MAAFPNFIGGSARGKSAKAALARTVNLYLERVRTSNKTEAMLLHTPGVRPYATSLDLPGRALFEEDGRCFTVLGTKYKEVGLGGTLTDRGTVALDGLPAIITTNGDIAAQNLVISGDEGYIHDLVTNAFTHVVSDVTIAVMVDSFFAALDINSSTLRLSQAGTGLVWDGTDIAQRSLDSNRWIGMAKNNSEIWLMGRKSGEVWFAKGGSSFAFAPRQGLIIKPGLAATFSLKELNGRMFWLAQDENGASFDVIRADGYSPQPISTPDVSARISALSRKDDAVAMTYNLPGHSFYQLNFPTAGASFLFDDTTDTWVDVGEYDGERGEFGLWSPQYHAYAFDKHLVANAMNGVIHELSTEVYTDINGNPIRRERIVPLPFDGARGMIIDAIEVLMDTGLAFESDAVPEPQAMLRLSRTNAKTWGAEMMRSVGRQGQFEKRLRWHKLGTYLDGAVSLAFTAAHPIGIVGAELLAREMKS